MGYRPSQDLRTRVLGENPNTVLVDKMIGTAYEVVKLVSANIKYVKSVAYHMEYVTIMEQHLADIKKVAESIEYVDSIRENMDKLIVIFNELDMLKVVYDNLPDINALAVVAPEIKIVGQNISSVNTVAQNIAKVNELAENIQLIRTAYEETLEAARQAKLSEESASQDAASTNADRLHIDDVVAQFDVDATEAVTAINTAKTQGVTAVNTERTAAISEISDERSQAVVAIDSTRNSAIDAVNAAKTVGIDAVDGAGGEALTAIGTSRSDALLAIEQKRLSSVNSVEQQGTSVLNGINTAGSNQVTAVNSAGSTQTTKVTNAGTKAVQDIGEKQSEAESSINDLMSDAQGYVAASKGFSEDSEASAQRAETATAGMLGGTSGQIMAKKSDTNYDYHWINIPGGGDMVSGVYDPDGIAKDVFLMDHMKDSVDFFRLTKAEKDRIASYPYGSLSGVPTTFAPSAHDHQLADVIGLQDVLNTFVAGPASAGNGKIVIFSGTSGKAVVASEMDVTEVLKRSNHTGTIEQTVVNGLSEALAEKAPLDLATGSKAGLMSALSFSRLAAMEDEATKNATDAALRNRATHTGKQDIDTVTGLPEALNAKAGLDVATAAANGLMSKENFSKLSGVEVGAQKNPDMALYQTAAQKGVANGYAGLNVAGKVPESQLPDTVLGSLQYQNAWNAATNTPAIPTATAANKGHYYMVQVGGTTAIDGENDWEVGDWIVSNGTKWTKIDNTDSVVSVAGLKGVIATAALQTALGLKSAAYTESSAYATAADGTLARSAVQPAGLTKAAVGLGKVEDKTEAERVASGAIADKFASERSTTNTALGTKADKANPAFTGNATFAGTIVANQNISAFSDQRLKSNIQTIEGALDKVMALRGTTYLKDNTYQYGVIAQEVEQVLPELVYEQPQKGDPFWNAGQRPTLSVDTGNAFTAILIEAIKELKAEVEALKAQIKG